MLKNVLKEVNDSKVFSKILIGRNLNISEALVEEAVAQLIRMGYIIEDETSPTCETTCSGCAYTSVCNTVTVKTFSISAKGNSLLEKENLRV